MNIQINNANSLPMPTWRWLKLNDTTISYDNIDNLTAVEAAVLNTSENIVLTHEKDNTFPKVTTGISSEANAFVENNATNINYITVKANTTTETPFIITNNLQGNQDFIDDNYIVAEENSIATIIVVYNSNYHDKGFHASSTKIFAKANAKINLIQVQTLGKDYFNFDDIGSLAEDNAQVSIKQIVLGAKNNYLGANVDLPANNTELFAKVDYLASQDQNIDMNYVVNILGKKTQTTLLANGILMNNAKKTLRGTLDFKQGCKGSVGTESEEVLLLDEDIHNKSIPLILCGEDDIEGNHSASIGEMDSQQLFYLQTRGLTEKQIRQMQIESKIQLMCNELPEELQAYILNYQQEAFVHEQ